MENIDSVVMNDILLDTALYIENDVFSYETYPRSINEFNEKLTAGRMPEAEDEVVIKGQDDEYTFSEDMVEDIIDQDFKIYVNDENEVEVTVVGVAVVDDENSYSYSGDLYMQDSKIRELLSDTYSYGSSVVTNINGKEVEYGQGDSMYKLMPSDKVARGQAVMTEEVDNFYADPNSESETEIKAKGHDITVKIKNMFFEDSIQLKIADTYTDKTYRNLTGNDDYDMYSGATFINTEDYNKLFDKGNFQCSVYVKDPKTLDETNAAIKRLGYVTLPLKSTVVVEGQDVEQMIKVPITILIIIAIFAISYLVAGLILRSRTIYFSILRMLGMAKRDLRKVMIVMNIAFAIFLGVVYLVSNDYISISYLKTLVGYMTLRDYIILYVLTGFMAIMISSWFSRKLFKKTAMGNFREEV